MIDSVLFNFNLFAFEFFCTTIVLLVKLHIQCILVYVSCAVNLIFLVSLLYLNVHILNPSPWNKV